MRVFILLFLMFITTSCSQSSPPLTPEQVENNRLIEDSNSAKIRAKEFIEATLKAPSTAKWPSYTEFATARATDKKNIVIKDLWQVTGYVDAQNSYGAMLRTKWYVKVKKIGDDWKLVSIDTY